MFKSHLFVASVAEQVVLAQPRNTMFIFGKHFFLEFLLDIWVTVQITALESFLQLRNKADT